MANSDYDLVVIGGGIYGASVAWEATLRGLSVALVDKADFGSATSANSLKIIHGGLRYLQHADFRRMRASIYERRTLMKIAPHLIHPLPVLIPVYGHGPKGKEAMTVAMMINDWVSCDRNHLNDPQKHIPKGRVISARECQDLLPGVSPNGMTGGAIFYDAQVYNSERLTLSFIRKAAQAGAQVANYAEVIGFLQTGNQIKGVRIKDVLTQDEFELTAKTVVNTSGPWVNHLLNLVDSPNSISRVPQAKAVNIVIRRPVFDAYAVGISSTSSSSDPDALINKGSRLLFIAPWRGKSMIGTAYSAYDQHPDDFRITKEEVQELLDDVNQSISGISLTLNDVDFLHGGLLPRRDIDPKTGEPILMKQYYLNDHTSNGLKGLISVVGVKYTTARGVAQTVIDRVFKSWGHKPPVSKSDATPLQGGDIDDFESFLGDAIAHAPHGLDSATMQQLIYNYGSAYPNVLRYLKTKPGDAASAADVLEAETLHAVREEMALTLADVVFRRTEVGSAGIPEGATLSRCAQAMGEELGWSHTRIQREIQQTASMSPMHYFPQKANLS